VIGAAAGDHPAMEILDLEPLLAKPLPALSAGEMRRLLIGRALIRNPRLLILDEPFNGLDRETARVLRALLDTLARSGVRMVLITHRANEIPDAFTHLLHLDRGRVRWSGPIAQFRPAAAPPRVPAGGGPGGPLTVPAPGGGKDTASKIVIRMRNVGVRYGDHQVLSGIDWTVREGENWALVGPNGAGKSTLLRLITGANLQGYANDIELFGRPKGSGESVWQIKQQIGYVADDLQERYQKRMSAYDVVCSGFFDSVGLYRRCTPEQRRTAREWMAATAIDHLSESRFARLSFGQQRMVLIVRAMVKSPRLLILDEPCNGLDADNRRQVLNLLDIIGAGPAGLIYVSHRPDEIPACITHRLFLEVGKAGARKG
jgi:molybdate transport system ATP-binding protein